MVYYAKLERRKGIWYARFKNFERIWKYKSCRKGIVKAEAIILASKWEDEATRGDINIASSEALQTLFAIFIDDFPANW